MKKLIVYLVVVVVTLLLSAEIIIIDSMPQDAHDANLPFEHHLTQEEIDYWQVHQEQEEEIEVNNNPPLPLPPDSVLKPVAEFDQMYGVLVRYPLGIPLELVRQLSLDTKVITIVSGNSVKNQAISAYSSAQVNMANCDFILANTDSYWTRDYGPWFSYGENGDLNVIDFNYNRPRPNDNAFIPHYGSYDTLAVYNMGIYQTGGNYMSDGIFIASSTQIAYTENGNNQNLVNQVMNDYLGVETYHVVQDPTGEYIDHIDCWGKFLKPDTILIRAVPQGHPRYNQIEQIASIFASQISAWDRPYKVVRVNTPSNQPYTNSLILNNKIFVPIMSSSGTNDLAALQVYQNAMPGYTVVGVVNNTQNPWLSTDALHCRTHELPDKRAIIIQHIPLAETMDYPGQIQISAEIYSFTGYELNPELVNVYYQSEACGYAPVNMLASTTTPNVYTATLPEIYPGGEFEYYIVAEDYHSNVAMHPFIGEPQAHKVTINLDTTPPIIDHTPITEINQADMPLTIWATVTDNTFLLMVTLVYYTNALETEIYVPMQEVSPSVYSCTLDIALEGVEVIYYRIKATDVGDPPNITQLPTNRWFSIAVLPVSVIDETTIMPPTTVSVYPNPFNASRDKAINVRLATNSTNFITLEMYNIKGQKVLEKDFWVEKGSLNTLEWSINQHSLPSSVYFMRIKGDRVNEARKVLILK